MCYLIRVRALQREANGKREREREGERINMSRNPPPRLHPRKLQQLFYNKEMKVPPRSYLAMQLALRRFLPLLPEFIFLLILFIFLPVLPHADALNTDNFNGSVRPSIESFFSLYNRRPICCVFRRDLSRVSNSYDSLGGNGGSSRLRVCGSRRNVCSACRAHARVSLSTRSY